MWNSFNAQQVKQVYRFKNIKERLHKTIESIWYNQTCRQM